MRASKLVRVFGDIDVVVVEVDSLVVDSLVVDSLVVESLVELGEAEWLLASLSVKVVGDVVVEVDSFPPLSIFWFSTKIVSNSVPL